MLEGLAGWSSGVLIIYSKRAGNTPASDFVSMISVYYWAG